MVQCPQLLYKEVNDMFVSSAMFYFGYYYFFTQKK